MNFRFLYTLACAVVLSFFAIQTVLADATGARSVERGQGATIHWNVTGAVSCEGGFDVAYPFYPVSSDGIYTAWFGKQQTVDASGNGSTPFSKVLGDAAKFASFPEVDQKYRFICIDYLTGASDFADLTVTDCVAPKVWDVTSLSCTDATLKICQNSCDSGNSARRDNKTFNVSPATPATLYACYGGGSCSGDDTEVAGVWNGTDTPNDAVDLSTNSGTSTVVTGTNNGQEQIDLTYNAKTVSTIANVGSGPIVDVLITQNGVFNDQVPYGGVPGFELTSSAVGGLCYIRVNNLYILSAFPYVDRQTFFRSNPFTSVGSNNFYVAGCYDPTGVYWSGWTVLKYFTVLPPPTPTSSVSVNGKYPNPDPVVFGSDPAFTLTSADANFCFVSIDGVWNPYLASGPTSGTSHNGSFVTSGPHVASSFCMNTDTGMSQSGWTVTPFTVLPAPDVTLSVDPSSRISYGNSPVLTWMPTNATSCWAWSDSVNNDGGWTTVADSFLNGDWKTSTAVTHSKAIVNLRKTTTYSIQCWNAANYSTEVRSVTVEVLPFSALSVTPGFSNTIPYNAATSLRLNGENVGIFCQLGWYDINGTPLGVDNGIFPDASGHVFADYPTGNLTDMRSYSFRCFNSSGGSNPNFLIVTVGPVFGCASGTDPLTGNPLTMLAAPQITSYDPLVVSNPDGGKVVPGGMYKAPVSLGLGDICFRNNTDVINHPDPGNTYFAPVKTADEFSSFWAKRESLGLVIIP